MEKLAWYGGGSKRRTYRTVSQSVSIVVNNQNVATNNVTMGLTNEDYSDERSNNNNGQVMIEKACLKTWPNRRTYRTVSQSVSIVVNNQNVATNNITMGLTNEDYSDERSNNNNGQVKIEKACLKTWPGILLFMLYLHGSCRLD